MGKYRLVIVDDEIDSQITLQSFISEYCPFIELAGTYSSVKECLPILLESPPDILLLDVSLSDGTGFDIVEKISPLNTKIIMITAHAQFAVDAYKYKIEDYLLKPIKPGDFQKSIKSITDQIDAKQEIDELRLQSKALNIKLGIPAKNELHITSLQEIIRCEANGNYTYIYVQNKDRIIVPKTIKRFEETLSQNGFIRVHQSHLLNQQHIDKVVLNKNQIILHNQTEIPISRKYKTRVITKFKLKLN